MCPLFVYKLFIFLHAAIIYKNVSLFQLYYYIPESKSENNFSSYATESQVQSKGKLNAIFSPKKLLKRGQIALFSIVRLKPGVRLKPPEPNSLPSLCPRFTFYFKNRM